ncbi:MAG: hypothetical protein ACR2LK_04820 [Solirubrobacteraceae bacterium]
MNVQDAHDALLTWCSEIGGADIDAFRASCRHLKLPASASARILSALGHVEFDWAAGRFAAAPTTLTTVPGLPGRLLVTGARPHNLIAELADVARDCDLDVDVWRDLCHQFGKGPSTAFIDADAADGPAFCDAALIEWGACASEQIAACLPDVRVNTATVGHRPDTRFPHALIDPHTFQARWDLTIPDGHAGLWLYRTWGRWREMILRAGDDEPRLIIDADYAPYLMERPDAADPIVEYRRAHSLLIVNAASPLPGLHARCACMCSGRLPVRRDVAPGVAYEHYVNVTPNVAQRIMRSLGVPT